MVKAPRRRGEAGKPRARVRPYRPPTIARRRDAVRRPSQSGGWWRDQFDLAQSPHGPFFSVFMIGSKWLITLMFLGPGFGLTASALHDLGAHDLRAFVAGAVLGAISLALGVFFLRMTPSDVLAMRRFRG
ncbi:hypothetical protein Cs7R123_47700 [Catellatospora sp. TT07R-123]|uniref:hypothetical protein n=1 Tax=Catellatospora sp. TT07R-123 TaxID=2733863 RepID=UPI001B22276B|nr:hypothetical protein [Catellatospora sp. TT07R-123]GHJ47428.1 hypothetical protein Cs7R123_47700 [Catellatospora sp. TT07R-123]